MQARGFQDLSNTQRPYVPDLKNQLCSQHASDPVRRIYREWMGRRGYDSVGARPSSLVLLRRDVEILAEVPDIEKSGEGVPVVLSHWNGDVLHTLDEKISCQLFAFFQEMVKRCHKYCGRVPQPLPCARKLIGTIMNSYVRATPVVMDIPNVQLALHLWI